MLLPPQLPQPMLRREVQAVVEAAAVAEGVRLVHKHAHHVQLLRQAPGVSGILGVDAAGMAGALPGQDLAHPPHRRVEVGGPIDRQHERQLLAREGIVGSDPFLLHHDEAGGRRARHPESFGEHRHSARDQGAAELAIGPQQALDGPLLAAVRQDPAGAGQSLHGLVVDRIKMTTEFSEEQDVALSNVFEAQISSAARSRSALSSMTTGTLPAPTPIAGVPLE